MQRGRNRGKKRDIIHYFFHALCFTPIYYGLISLYFCMERYRSNTLNWRRGLWVIPEIKRTKTKNKNCDRWYWWEVGFALLRIRAFAWSLLMPDENKFRNQEADGDSIIWKRPLFLYFATVFVCSPKVVLVMFLMFWLQVEGSGH